MQRVRAQFLSLRPHRCERKLLFCARMSRSEPAVLPGTRGPAQGGLKHRLSLFYPARQRRFSEQETMEMYSRSGRIETRISLEVMVRIASLEHPGLVDTGITQNASPFGLRAIVRKRWMPNEPVL